jgi:CRP-like cAMP-binding protein
MGPIDKQTFLNTHYLFRDLDPAVVARIAALGVTRGLGAEEILFQKGDSGDALYAVLSGRIRISTNTPGGKEIVFAIMEPGEVFGEIALLDGMARTADASAIGPAELFMIYRRDFLNFLEREPRLAIHLLQLVCGRLRRTDELVEDAAFLALPARLAKRLLSLAECHGEPDPRGVRVELQISQNQLGQLTGTSRESVNKHLQRWRKKGWVALGRNRVMIRNCQALQELVDTELEG